MGASCLNSVKDLFAFFQKGEKKEDSLKIGTEHEVFLFDKKTGARANASQISLFLEDWSKEEGEAIYENGAVIGLKKKDSSLSLEPGGQFELSGASLGTLHETAQEIRHHQDKLSRLANQHQLFPLAMGADPITLLADRPWMNKDRYKIMRPYMATVGSHGHEMMTGTCTVQVNLDYTSEKDMVKKMRVGMALQPLVTALFAHSSISLAKPSGYQSRRRFFWNNTDSDRCGLLPFVFDESMGYERYIDYALSVPMYFVRRNGRYLDVAGIPFKDFLAGDLKALPGEKPTLQDWSDHLTILFPEVRLKQYIEMRGADSAPFPYLMALPSFWVGLLYSSEGLQKSYDLIREWPLQDILHLSDRVDRDGIHTSFLKRPLTDWLKEILALSKEGLQDRGLQEDIYLEPLFRLLETGKSLSDKCRDFLESGHDVEELMQAYTLQKCPEIVG